MSIVSGPKLEFRVLLLAAGGKLNIPERNRRTTNSTHVWSKLQESNPSRSGAVLSPPFTKKYSVQKLRMTWVTRLQFTRAWPWPLRERRKYAQRQKQAVSLKYIEKNSLTYPPPPPLVIFTPTQDVKIHLLASCNKTALLIPPSETLGSVVFYTSFPTLLLCQSYILKKAI